MNNKYAFIKIRTGHTVVRQLLQILGQAFPNLEMEVIDVKPLLKQKPLSILFNIFHMIKIYGIDKHLFEKRIFYNRFFGTPYMFHKINDILKYELANKDYIFTFQDNTLFNGNCYKFPHFIYTDYTILANKNNPYFNSKSDMLSEEWIELEKKMYSDALRVFTRTEDARNSLIQDYSCHPDKVFTVYFAPFPSSDESLENLIKNKSYSNNNILFVGTEWERKGGPELLKAFAEVRKKIPDAKLTIVGHKQKISSPNVQYIGEISRNETHKFFSQASVFCLPTHWDTAPIVFIEAMRYGLPLVGTRVGGIPEYIKDGYNGYLIDSNNTSHLRNILLDLLSHQDKCRIMGSNSLALYHKTFTMNKTAERFRSLMQDALASQNHQSNSLQAS